VTPPTEPKNFRQRQFIGAKHCDVFTLQSIFGIAFVLNERKTTFYGW
jgi:hypothetical protein